MIQTVVKRDKKRESGCFLPDSLFTYMYSYFTTNIHEPPSASATLCSIGVP